MPENTTCYIPANIKSRRSRDKFNRLKRLLIQSVKNRCKGRMFFGELVLVPAFVFQTMQRNRKKGGVKTAIITPNGAKQRHATPKWRHVLVLCFYLQKKRKTHKCNEEDNPVRFVRNRQLFNSRMKYNKINKKKIRFRQKNRFMGWNIHVFFPTLVSTEIFTVFIISEMKHS